MKKLTHLKYSKYLSKFFIILTCNYLSCIDKKIVYKEYGKQQENLTTLSQIPNKPNGIDPKNPNDEKTKNINDNPISTNDKKTIKPNNIDSNNSSTHIDTNQATSENEQGKLLSDKTKVLKEAITTDEFNKSLTHTQNSELLHDEKTKNTNENPINTNVIDPNKPNFSQSPNKPNDIDSNKPNDINPKNPNDKKTKNTNDNPINTNSSTPADYTIGTLKNKLKLTQTEYDVTKILTEARTLDSDYYTKCAALYKYALNLRQYQHIYENTVLTNICTDAQNYILTHALKDFLAQTSLEFKWEDFFALYQCTLDRTNRSDLCLNFMKEAQSLGLDDKYLSELGKSVLNQTESINHSIDLLEEVTKLLHNKTYCVELWKIFVDKIKKPYTFNNYIDIILITVQSLGLDDICLAELCTYICNQTQDIKGSRPFN